MRNLFLIAVVLFLFSSSGVYAQELVKGVVKDEKGETIAGVNVGVKGTTIGAATDIDGNYSIDVVKEDAVLEFSFIGYLSVEEKVGGRSVINVTLPQDSKQLKEVVVTALGISREKESLGYSTQEVGGDALTKVQTNNFANSISGKAAGVNIKRNNNFGGSTNVVIRGSSSLTGNNQALFVIDGVPISNDNNNDSTQGTARSGYDYGNAASDINPDDIEYINILKGAAATALYGSRAANGVVIIRTKKGKKSNAEDGGKPGVGISIRSGFNFGVVDKSTFPVYQNQYGAGYGGAGGAGNGFVRVDLNNDGVYENITDLAQDASYGPRFDDSPVYQYDAFVPESPNFGKATPWKAAENGPLYFFETPTVLTNSISFEKGTDFASYRLNYTRSDQTGLMPNSKIEKNNFSLSSQMKLTDKLTVQGFGNYIRTNGKGRNGTGYSNNITGSFRQWYQTNVDIKQQKELYEATQRNVTWNPKAYNDPETIFWDNPYFLRYQSYQTDERSRFLGYASVKYDIFNWLDVFGRVALDTYSELQEERLAPGSNPKAFGVGSGADGSVGRASVGSGYVRRNITSSESNYDFIVHLRRTFGDKFNLAVIAGWNLRNQYRNRINASTSGGLSTPLYALAATTNSLVAPFEREEQIRVRGLYGSVSFGYDGFLYLDVTYRNDKSSTLPAGNNSFSYPSVSTSFIFSKFTKQFTDVISFGKLRLNYAVVGNDAIFARTRDYYTQNVPFGGASSSVNVTKNNANLKPESTASYEIGTEMKFFKGRVGLDFSYYHNSTTDQILPLPVSRSTGYSFLYVNAGEITNQGVELSLSGTPVEMKDFSWNIGVNWTLNRNKVETLYSDESGQKVENLLLGTFQGGVTINAREGQPYGTIQGTDYVYLNGQRVVDPNDGQYLTTAGSDNVIGNTNPDWNMGITNTFQYKNLVLSFLVDMQIGGDVFSLDQYYGLATGLYEETAFTNDLGNPVRNTLENGGGFINEGVNPDGTQNTTRIRADRFGAQGYRRGLPNKAFVYDASYVKLREVSLTYRLPKRFFTQIFITGASVSFVGSNLWIIFKNLPHADPESGVSSGNLQGYSTGSLPTTRQFGFNLNFQF